MERDGYMQLDLALFLRLSRTLEASQSIGQVASDEHQDVLRALDQLFLTVAEQMDLLRAREAAQPAAETAVDVEELEETKELTVEEELPPEVPETELPPQVWTAQHDLLYEDILWLFRVGDNEGALVSLGRLLNVAGQTPELERFLEINESKLVGLYERLLGSFQRPLTVSDNGLGDRYFWDVQEAQELLKLGRAAGTLATLLERSPYPTMKTLAMAHRLQREGLFQFSADDAAQPAR